MSTADTDVLVVGGGPVGLAAAVEVRLAGLSCLLVEPRTHALDKACGEGLLPGALRSLERLGVGADGMDLVGIRYVDGNRQVAHRFRAGPGRGVRRTELSTALAARAEEVGVLRRRGRVERVEQDGSLVRARCRQSFADPVAPSGDDPADAEVSARWLLACDGLHSPLRRELGLTAPAAVPGIATRRAVRRYGIRRHFRVAPWSDHVEVHWATDAEVYVTPVAPDCVGVAVLGPRGLSYDTVLAGSPALRERLDGAAPVGDLRGAGPLYQRALRRVTGRVLLVGDAAGYVDALTGEGLQIGFASARAAVSCLVRGDPRGYERAWRSLTRDYRAVTGGLLLAAQRPRLRRAIVPTAARLPGVYGALVDRVAG